jgi:hypothetical protein
MEAVERYGVLRGSFMTLQRLLRCHPVGRGGYDPVTQDSKSPAEYQSVAEPCAH